MKAYGGGLTRKPELIALNKCDALTPAEIKRKVAALKKISRKDIHVISAVAQKGVTEVLGEMAKKIAGKKG